MTTTTEERHPCRYATQGCDYTSPAQRGATMHANTCAFNPNPTPPKRRSQACLNCGRPTDLGAIEKHRTKCLRDFPLGKPVLGELPGTDLHVDAVRWLKAVAKAAEARPPGVPAGGLHVAAVPPAMPPMAIVSRAWVDLDAIDVDAVGAKIATTYPDGFATSDPKANAAFVRWLLEQALEVKP